VARFAAAGKSLPKKPLALMAMAYGYVYVAQVAIGADKQQFLNAVIEAENYNGPSIIIAYSPCIAHGLPMSQSVEEEKRAVECGYWDLFRFNPSLIQEHKNPFHLDSKTPAADFEDFLMRENRFASLKNANPDRARKLFEKAEQHRRDRRAFYEKLATLFQNE
jgi:pyruvate-ferredoxin/flavodoxin oxidoreductase